MAERYNIGEAMNLPVQEWTTLQGMLRSNAEAFGARPAILGEGGVELSHQDVYRYAESMRQALRGLGIGREARVAIVMPQGHDLALCFLGVVSSATAAPLNPGYSEREFAFNLEDLSASALIVSRGFDSPARSAAGSLKIPVLELVPVAESGGLAIFPGSSVEGADQDSAQPLDVVLVLHTSGTTSRPKRVPLSHGNLCASARNVAGTLALQSADRSLSTMPLFHIHGLVCMLAALSAGGSCVCAGPFRPDKFAGWLERFEPTWFSTVPTVLQSLLDQARDVPFAAGKLRLIRSSSASLPPALMDGLESAFGVPVIEAYGMTEAAHQMCCNPLAPGGRRRGSVGFPAGPEVAILDEAGRQLERGRVGEISIRGANVTSGYESNEAANAAAFTGGWFQTGDQGYFDSDGYLFISGRLKELINRGGEKIVPREIDEALLAHPDVRQAVTFAVPHASLGEDVAVAVVLQPEATCEEEELRNFLFERLADYKVPSRVVMVPAIPLGPTGKMQRIGMADRLASFMETPYALPSSPMERMLAKMIAEALKLDRVGRHDNFFALGGDSLLATRLVTQIDQRLGSRLPAATLFQSPTVASLARRLERQDWKPEWTSLVPLQPKGERPVLFFVHGHQGDVFIFVELARLLGLEQPTYGVQGVAVDGKSPMPATLEEAAANYAREMDSFQPEGPLYLAGMSMGGMFATEVARQLRLRGREVGMLLLFDTAPTGKTSWFFYWIAVASHLPALVNAHLQRLRRLQLKDYAGYIAGRWAGVRYWLVGRNLNLAPPFLQNEGDEWAYNLWTDPYRRLAVAYRPRPLAAPIDMLVADDAMPGWRVYWRWLARGGIRFHRIAGTHKLILQPENVGGLAKTVSAILAERQAAAPLVQ